jgi:atypical dual specificity phosphatase
LQAGRRRRRTGRSGSAAAAGAGVDVRDFSAPGNAATRPHGNCYWLVTSRLLAGEHPGATGPEELPQRLLALRDAGVSCCIDLTSPADPVLAYAPPDTPRFSGVRLSHPIADFGVPDLSTMERIAADVAAALAEGRTLYLHCRAGIGRTGMVAACLMVSAGMTAEQALAQLAAKWQVVDKRHAEPNTPETEAQREFVRRWQQHVQRPDAGRSA